MTGMLLLFMAAESASADMSQPYGFPGRVSTSANMTKRIACTVKGCTYTLTHHHLDELKGRPSFCDGSSDEYDQVKTCCELGPLLYPNPDPDRGGEK